MNLKTEITLIRSCRRTLAIELRPDSTLLVRAPRRLSLKEIHRFILGHESWITRKKAELASRPEPAKKQFLEGEEFPVQGQSCRLKLVESASSCVNLSGNRLVFPIQLLPTARESLTKWYREYARSYITDRVRHYARIMACCPSSLRITSPRRRWGSCGPADSLNFNWRLVMAPPEIIDYVVVHELAHIRYKHHGPEFWRFVGAYFPGHKNARRWLKDHGHQLDF
ncbi:hypothetical protein Dform_01586 [Dehalogenimonas formicexedens]|uniref:YgjP-like metallopeptidase domain-containing protein n=1 Tax=Dehalogenimonas formicexedens TaxID=1839801 RepID=A0A1P8F8W3_9CHLR|nr:SprT family zinc-dependent metalloprotease [Dehalogenimonas formicexedens]APV44907.1 hypothetical protein Dform_01586 [Dehalogenimonas formicexedens]